jgi:hypothetical protein
MLNSSQRRNWQIILFYVTLTVSFVGLVLFIFQINKTFGFRDESFYALSMEYPFSGIFKVMDYSVYLSILYIFFNKSLYAVRLIWFLLQLASGCIAGSSLCFMLKSLGVELTRINLATIILVTTTATCSYYSTRYFTPSYNSWNLVWILLCLSALFLYSGITAKKCFKTISYKRYLTLLFVALSGSMVFLAKPTSALGLALAALLWMVFLSSNLNYFSKVCDIAIAFSISVLILVLHFEFISEGLLVNYDKYKLGLTLTQAGRTHSVGNLLAKYFSHDFYSVTFFSKIVLFFLFGLAVLSFRYSHGRNIFYYISLVSFSSAISWGVYIISNNGAYILGDISLLVFLSAIFAWSLMHKNSTVNSKYALFVFVLLFISAISYGFGSNNYPSVHLTSGFSLTALATITVLGSTGLTYRSSLISFGGICLVLFSLSSLLPTLRAPQEVEKPLSVHFYEVVFREGTRPLKLTQSQQKVLSDVKRAALSNGWKLGTPFINLVPTFTVVPYFLEARQLVSNWAFRPKHIDIQTFVWLHSQISQHDIENAWIMCRSDTSDKSFFSANILVELGVDFPRLYSVVFEDESIQIWKPKLSASQKNDPSTIAVGK